MRNSGNQSDLSFKVQFDRVQVVGGPGALCLQVQQVLDGFSSLPHRHISSPQRVCQLGCHHVYTLQRDIAGMAGLLAHLGSYAGVERQRKCRCHPGGECMMLHMQMQSGSEMHDTACAAGIRFR